MTEAQCWDYINDAETDIKKFVDLANRLGDDGWELVDVSNAHGFYIGVFKRPMNRMKEL